MADNAPGAIHLVKHITIEKQITNAAWRQAPKGRAGTIRFVADNAVDEVLVDLLKEQYSDKCLIQVQVSVKVVELA